MSKKTSLQAIFQCNRWELEVWMISLQIFLEERSHQEDYRIQLCKNLE
jgi:hypothetical protein